MQEILEKSGNFMTGKSGENPGTRLDLQYTDQLKSIVVAFP